MQSGPFYAYAINRDFDAHFRLVLVFANRATADEWWREVSKDTFLNNIQRITPQFYAYNNSKAHLYEFFNHAHYKTVSNKFIGRMLVQLENDRGGRGIDILPPINITEHLSGGWFHVRSIADPRMYWSYQDGHITLSDDFTKRTAFCVKASDEPDGTVMIGRDNITISVSPDKYLLADQNGGITVAGAQSRQTFTFKDFAQGKFLLEPSSSNLVYQPDHISGQDVWELVCSHTSPIQR